MAVEIHNGQVVEDGVPAAEPGESQATEQLEIAKGDHPDDLDPEIISREMARTVSEAQADKCTPMEIVTRLLQLRNERGKKLVWTRFDLFQCFALWSKKMEGSQKL